MKILNYFETDNKEYWIEEISKSDWRAAAYLAGLLKDETFHEKYGEKSQLLLLTEEDRLISFCTYAERDEINDESLKPWIGFAYTFPEFRGKMRLGKLIEYIYIQAKKDGYEKLYISTEEEGLYEKYGFGFWKIMKNEWNEDTRVYRKRLTEEDYSNIIGMKVKGTIDRPLGRPHPRHPEMIYPINYGYVDGLMGGDGMEQDVYVFGTEEPLSVYEGTVVGVIHRLNDIEDKWIVSLDGEPVDRETILKRTEFQEQYYMGELYL